jgi:predicted aspartyl protease
MYRRFAFSLLTMVFTLAVPGFAKPLDGTLRFDVYRGYLMVARGSAGPVKGLNFLLDTGTSPSILDTRLADRLHLERSPAQVHVVGGTVPAERAVALSLTAGPLERENVPVLVEDLSFFHKALPFPIDGVLGLDILGQSAFMIDYPGHVIRFGAYPVMAVSAELHLAGGLAIVEVEVNHLPAHLLLDTGAAELTLFAGSAPQPVHAMKISAATTIGEFEQKQVRLPSLKVGETEWRSEPATLVAGRGYAFDGLLSPAMLGMKRVVIDLPRGQLGLSR